MKMINKGFVLRGIIVITLLMSLYDSSATAKPRQIENLHQGWRRDKHPYGHKLRLRENPISEIFI